MELDVYIESEQGLPRAERLTADGQITIGRHSKCVLYLDGDRVSRTHAVMEVRADGFWIEDRSSNGTVVGDRLLRHEAAEAIYGTPIVIGPYTLYVKPAVAAPAFGPPPLPPPGMREPMPGHFAETSVGLPIAPGLAALQGLPLPPPPPPITRVPPGDVEAQVGDATALEPPPGLTFGPPPPPPPPRMRPPRPIPPPQAQVHDAGTVKPSAPPPVPAEKVILGSLARVPEPPPSAPAMPEPAPPPTKAAIDEQVALRREIHAKLLENLDLAKLDAAKLDDPSMRPRVLVALRRIVTQLAARLEPGTDKDALVGELADEALGLGPLERFLSDPTISEVMVVDPNTIYIEQGGKLVKADARFTDDERVRAVIERIVTPLGRRIDESSPLVDARLKDGSRVNAVIRPLALRGSCITIRKFAKVPLTVEKLVSFGALTPRMARFLERAVVVKKNIVISGGTGSGKTTLLNVLSAAIPADERIVTIEDAAELQLTQPHVVGLESRPPNMEGRGEYTIRDLVRNALRMRPDRIVVGECRGGEALDMLQAMNTGHDGSLTTTHANSPPEAIARLETLALMGGLDLPSRAIREQIAASIHLVVQQTRFSDGSRRISAISEVSGIEDDGQISIRPIFEFVRTGTGPGGKVIGEHRATGYLPSFLDAFIVAGLIRKGEPYI
ncbi:MAG: Flp pilus assembly complex ATPase component TadA [Polyangiaceae bacterium]|nr:Flp pilus assembly complex ATPase component TadA [Polyangiaceae bacterium]